MLQPSLLSTGVPQGEHYHLVLRAVGKIGQHAFATAVIECDTTKGCKYMCHIIFLCACAGQCCTPNRQDQVNQGVVMFGTGEPHIHTPATLHYYCCGLTSPTKPCGAGRNPQNLNTCMYSQYFTLLFSLYLPLYSCLCLCLTVSASVSGSQPCASMSFTIPRT